MLNLKMRCHAAAVLTALSPFGASADLLPEAFYADELQRCVSEIRSALQAGQAEAVGDLRHEVKSVERARMWYEFEIATYATARTPVLARTQTCRSYRYEPRAMLEAQQMPAASVQVAQER